MLAFLSGDGDVFVAAPPPTSNTQVWLVAGPRVAQSSMRGIGCLGFAHVQLLQLCVPVQLWTPKTSRPRGFVTLTVFGAVIGAARWNADRGASVVTQPYGNPPTCLSFALLFTFRVWRLVYYRPFLVHVGLCSVKFTFAIAGVLLTCADARGE